MTPYDEAAKLHSAMLTPQVRESVSGLLAPWPRSRKAPANDLAALVNSRVRPAQKNEGTTNAGTLQTQELPRTDTRRSSSKCRRWQPK